MKKIDFGQTFSVLANAGVLVGIVFLAIEVRQNGASLEEANRLNEIAVNGLVLERNSEFTFTIAGDEQLSRIWINGLADAELDPLDAERFRMLCQQNIWNGIILDRSETNVTGQASGGGNAPVIRRSIDSSSHVRNCWNDMKDLVSFWGYDWFVQAVDNKVID